MDIPVELRIGGRAREGGVSRRGFLGLLGGIAAVLGLPLEELLAAYTKSLAKTPRIPVIWLGFQDCTGDTESFIRAGERQDPIESSIVDPGIVDLLLDIVSLEYHETLMAPSGAGAEKSRTDTIAKYKGKYLAIVEGSIPTKDNGVYCMIGGKTALSIAKEVCANAKAVIAAGSCAVSGALASAKPNPTLAKGLLEAIPTLTNVANLPGCPVNAVNLMASIVYLIAYGKFPSLDGSRRPKFAYDGSIHERCPRKDYYEHGPHVGAWGDANHRAGRCFVRMSCRGPRTHGNCSRSNIKWIGGTSWPVLAGHGCIGCTEPRFWDTMFPLYNNPDPADD
jgi:hydrogenase small subunit